MYEFDKIYNEDCLEGLKSIPNNSIDLVVTDPPYEFVCGGGGGAFGTKKRNYHAQYISLAQENETDGRLVSKGFDFSVLDECCRVLKKMNFYVWCSKAQVRKLLDYFEDKGCNTDILVWCKTNPTPMCNNTYLSDIEYCIYAREKGVPMYGEYATKHKFWVSECNVDDKKLWGHPTIKPCNYIRQEILNSSKRGGVILDPFMGSGTTAVAAIREHRHFIGFELDKGYYEKACKRIALERQQLSLDFTD